MLTSTRQMTRFWQVLQHSIVLYGKTILIRRTSSWAISEEEQLSVRGVTAITYYLTPLTFLRITTRRTVRSITLLDKRTWQSRIFSAMQDLRSVRQSRITQLQKQGLCVLLHIPTL